MIAEEPINERADRAASRLRAGINKIFERRSTAACAYGVASLVLVLFGVRGYESDQEITRGLNPAISGMFRLAMFCAGVDNMAHNRFIVSAVHSDDDIDNTLSAIEQAVERLKAEHII